MNSTSCTKSNLILDLLHNLHVIRNDLQSHKTHPTEILTAAPPTAAAAHPQMNFSTMDSGTFSISVQIILVKPDAFETNYRWGHLIRSRTPTDEIGFYCCATVPHCTALALSLQHKYCTLNIWLPDTLTKKPAALHQRKAITPRMWESVMCGNDLCHVPLIMVMIALGGRCGM